MLVLFDTHKLSAGGLWAEVLQRMMGNITVTSGEAETPRLTWKRTQNIKKGFDIMFKLYQDVRKMLEIIRFKSTLCFRDIIAPPVCFTDLQDVLHFQDAAVSDGVRRRGGDGQHQLGVHLRCVRTDGMSGHRGHGLGN